MTAWLWIVVIVVVLVVIALVAAGMRRRRSAVLRQRFGSEYDRTVEGHESQRAAEAELRDRERQRARLDIKPLSADSRERFTEEWRGVQERFVDQPTAAAVAADDIVRRVMAERGYPMGDFEAQADLVSVDHPQVVENYRIAHGIQRRAESKQATTEDLRDALLRYRTLFDELLADNGVAAEDDGPDAEVTGPAAEDGGPAGEETSPAGEETSPAGEETSPAGEDADDAGERAEVVRGPQPIRSSGRNEGV
jgi:hypothetical protein